MGFYGNITNTSKTTFSFDKIYTNRRDMDEACAEGDGVFLGRYVLVEYGATILNNIQEVYINGLLSNTLNTVYSDPTNRGSSYIVPWVEHKIVKIKYSTQTNRYYYYEGQKTTSGAQIWKKLNGYSVTGQDDDEAYKVNYDIDYQIYKRGYDSTVWIKQFINNEEKYVQIAELNTVVPMFQILPQAPHDLFTLVEVNSSNYTPNTYYYFNGEEYLKDSGAFVEGRKYYSVYTSPDGTPFWPPYVSIDELNSTNINYRIQVPTNFLLNLDSQNINVNLEGFNEKERHYDTSENNVSYKLGTTNYPYYYDVEQDNVTGEYISPDIKSLVINLPGLGNAACKTYDLLYGVNRTTNYDTDNVSGALNRINSKFDNMQALEAGKILYVSPEVNSNIKEKVIKSATIDGDDWITFTSTNNEDTSTFKLAHKASTLSNKTIAAKEQTLEFGSILELPSLTADDCGHIISQTTTKNVTLPQGSYETSNIGNIITQLVFTPASGKFKETKSYLGDILLGSSSYSDEYLKISDKTSLKEVITAVSNKISANASEADTKLANKIKELQVTDTVATGQFLTAVSQENGKIKVSRSSLSASDIPNITHNKISDWDTEVTNKINTHTDNNTIHITSEERTAWNNKLSSIPNTYVQTTTTFSPSGGSGDAKTISELYQYIKDLESRIATLEAANSTTE